MRAWVGNVEGGKQRSNTFNSELIGGVCGVQYEETENRGLEERLFSLVMDRCNRVRGLNTFGLKMTYLGNGTAGLKMVVGTEFSNAHGRTHGGLVAAALDTAIGVSVWTLGYDVVTLEMNLNYIAPVEVGDVVTCDGWVIHKGKTVVVGEGEMRDGNGKLMAKSRMTFYRVGELAGEDY